MKSLTIKTNEKKEIINITNKVEEFIPKERKGICTIHITHTTAAIATADLDPGTDQDMLDAFEEIMPQLNYRHPHDPSHVTDHIMSSIIGNSTSIPFKNGKLQLGTWQNIVLIELNGPRTRNIIITILCETT